MSKKLSISLFIVLNLAVQIIGSAAFASMFDTPVAMVTSFEGKVNFENSTKREIDFGTDIFIGDMLKTAENSSISLTFYNGCRQEVLDQKSVIQVGNNQSVLRSGQFKQIEVLECTIPDVVIQETDSHLKAGLVVRAVNNKPKVDLSSFMTPLVENHHNKSAIQLRAWTNHGKQPTFKIGEPIILHFLSNQDAYVVINYYSNNGEVFQLTPELLLEENKVSSKKLYSLGNKGSELIAGLPVGIDTIHIVASNKPIIINNQFEQSKAYFEELKKYISENPKQLYSEKLIKLTISQ